MTKKAFLLAAALLAAPAAADDPATPAANGVWQGMIGTYPVRVCLQQGGDSWELGSYYYLSQKKPIRLDRKESGDWGEMVAASEAPGATWHFKAVGNRLTGEWRRGERSLPIALERVPGSKDDADRPCGSRAFIAARIEPVTIVSKPRKLDGFGYTDLQYRVGRSFAEVSIGSFAYPASQPGDRAINARLKLDPNREGNEADYISCYQGTLGMSGGDGDFQFGFSPVEATARFLTVQVSSGGFCGGAHPNYHSNWRTFDRRTGQAIVLGRWFKAQAVPPEYSGGENGGIEASPALVKVFLRRFRFDEDECRDAVAAEQFWNVGLTSRGLLVSPSLPHALMVCSQDAVVPFADLAPFLSTGGKAELMRLGLGGK